MQESVRKREYKTAFAGPASISQREPPKKLSRQARARINKKHQEEEQSAILPEGRNSAVLIPDIVPSASNIVFNPNRHRTQQAARGLCTQDKIYYIEKEWTSTPLCPSDRVSNVSIKTQHEISTESLLVETLIREAKMNNNILESFEIPSDFLIIVIRDIINPNIFHNKETSVSSCLEKRTWIAFGRWLGFEGKIKRREVRQHLRLRWQKLKHALHLHSNEESSVLTTPRITKKEKNHMLMSVRDLKTIEGLVGFRYIINPECVVDKNNQTLLHLDLIENLDAINKATEAIDYYYFHTLAHPSHRSESFWKNFIEHFSVFTLNNLLPYVSSNTASSHNIEHLECVNKLLNDLVPLSNCINRFFQKYYGSLYDKLCKLKWGPFGVRAFRIFPMIAINYNTVSDYHWDESDEPNSLCCLVALGDFDGDELCFPQLKIIVPLRPGQVIVFFSRLLLHGNFPVTRGIRHSVVYFVHSSFFHHLQDFSSVYDDLKNSVERDAKGNVVFGPIGCQNLEDACKLNHQIHLFKLKAEQIQIPPQPSDRRRGCIDLSRARCGLRAEDPLPNS